MGLGVTTEGRGGELSIEPARPLVLLVRDELSVSLSEAAEAGREIVSTEEVRRMTLPMRADHFGLGLEVLMAEECGRWMLLRREDGKSQKRQGTSIIYEMPMPGGCVEASRGPDTSRERSNPVKTSSTQTRCIWETTLHTRYMSYPVPAQKHEHSNSACTTSR